MNTNQPSPIIISFLTLRKAIGILGITLPLILLAGSLLFGHCTSVQESISHYYYTLMGDVYVGVLCMVGLFLISYKGYNKADNVVSSIAGIAAISVAIFATSNNTDLQCTVRTLPHASIRIAVHYLSAALFFVSLAVIAFFFFTKSKGLITPEKKIRNRIYRTSAIVMIVSVLFIFLIKQIPWLGIKLSAYKPVFWLEWIALIAFGTSWLIKGKFLFEDK